MENSELFEDVVTNNKRLNSRRSVICTANLARDLLIAKTELRDLSADV